MVLLDDCRTRLRGALALLQRIGVAKDAQVSAGFQHIKAELRRLDADLQRTSDRPTVAEKQLVQSVQRRLYQFSISAGKLLRASNARNAFEWFSPFAALFRKIVNGQEHENDVIVFSSEWHCNLELERLPLQIGNSQSAKTRFAWFVGYPAFESENPHVLPVVGHEIAHALWHRRKLESLFKNRVQEGIDRSFREESKTSEAAEKARENACRQLEELFCDTVGALLFGPSFLYAFRYLLAPAGLSHGVRHTAGYPDLMQRAQHLIDLSSQFHWPLHEVFRKSLSLVSPPLNLRLSMKWSGRCNTSYQLPRLP